MLCETYCVCGTLELKQYRDSGRKVHCQQQRYWHKQHNPNIEIMKTTTERNKTIDSKNVDYQFIFVIVILHT